MLPTETKFANHALAHFIARMFSLMDRGYVFRLIKLYLDKFHTAKDSVPLHTYKFEFLAIVTSYEHYVPLNMPINFAQVLKPLNSETAPENAMVITEEFCRNHFLTGVLLQELRSALSEVHQVRGMALSVLRNLVVKHSIDPRYHSKFQQSRISSLYFPFISLIIENLNRIHIPGYFNSYLPLLSTSRLSNASAASVYNLQLYHSNQSTLTMQSRITTGSGVSVSSASACMANSKRVSFTDKFASLNSETSSILVQSLRRNSSLDSTLNIEAGKRAATASAPIRDSSYLNLIAGTSQLNPSMITNELLKLKRTVGEQEGGDERDDSHTLRSLDLDTLSVDSRSTSPFSHSSHSSTNTLTALSPGANNTSSGNSGSGGGGGTGSTSGDQTAAHSSVSETQSNSIGYTNHQRSHSLPIRFDKLNSKEVRDLLITFLWICKHAPEELMAGWARHASDENLIQFLTIVEICIVEFKYSQKRLNPINSEQTSSPGPAFWKSQATKSEKSMTLPTKIGHSAIRHTDSCNTLRSDNSGGASGNISEDVFTTLLEANLTSEVGLIALDLLSLLCSSLHTRLEQQQLQQQPPNLQQQSPPSTTTNTITTGGPLMKKLFQLHLTFFQFKQSEKLLQHLFASLRQFIHRFTRFLFAGTTEHISSLCTPLLKLCSSRLSSVRSDASILIYLLLRANFNHSGQTEITRMQLQLIISISQLLGSANVDRLNNARFQESLSMISNYACSDKSFGQPNAPRFVQLIKELVKSIRTVLQATVAMREHADDAEKLLDLQLQLANGYKLTSPALRRTWLEAMAKNHIKAGHLSEAAHCYAHISALEYECLRLKNTASRPEESKNVIENEDQNDSKTSQAPSKLSHAPSAYAVSFATTSPNIERNERRTKDEQQLSEDVRSSLEQQFSEPLLVRSLRTTIDMFARAERYEVIPEVYKILLPLYERTRDHETLAKMHLDIAETYEKIVSLQKSGKRFLGKFYRVGFYGRDYFGDDSGREFIYKEEKLTSLSEISQRLGDRFGRKHGHHNIKLIHSEKDIDEQVDCDSRFGYIQITHVIPYHGEKGSVDQPLSAFERENNIDLFMFETPFCLSDPRKARSSSCEDQAKRRTILRTTHCFPYVVKRIPVHEKRILVLSPIEVAIDEMGARVSELHEVIFQETPDLKRLHLKLGGSISVQVNAGPLAYAKAFINHRYPAEQVNQLRNVYREFVTACELGLHLNEKLIGQEQQQYHESLKDNFNSMVQELGDYCVEDCELDSDGLLVSRSFRIFDFISGSSNA